MRVLPCGPNVSNVRLLCEVAKDLFWALTSDEDLGSVVPYEGDEKLYQTLFTNNQGRCLYQSSIAVKSADGESEGRMVSHSFQVEVTKL